MLPSSNVPDSPQVSVVVPLFNEQENLPELYRRLSAALEEQCIPYEIVLVNDGSRDQTGVLITELAWSDEHVIAVHLSRNFGHQAAVCAGLEQARGQAVIVMDGDLQDPPEVLGQFLAKWREGFDAVYAVRTKRKEGLFKRAGYFLFYRLLRFMSDLDIPLDSGDFCLMDRKVVQALLALPERQRFVRGLRTFVGFRQTGLPYERAARAAGQPKYSLRALVRLAMDGLISFSAAPLAMITYLGLFSALLTFVLAGWVFANAFAQQAPPAGWASTMLVVLFLGSVQLLSLGVIGEYLRRIFIEVKARPTFIVREVIRKAAAPARGKRSAGGIKKLDQGRKNRPGARASSMRST